MTLHSTHIVGAVAVAAVALTARPANAACGEVVPGRQLALIVSSGDAAFNAMDETAFRTARAEAARLLPCVGEEVSSTAAASYHRLFALSAFLERDHAGTVASFRSVLASAPGYALPDDLAPPNHPLRIDFEVAEGLIAAPPQPLPSPRTGWIKVDGRTADGAPADRPWIFQHLDDNGQVVSTSLVAPGGDLPDYASRGNGSGGGRPGVNVPLAVTSGVATLASGALFLAARGAEAQFWDPATPSDDLQAVRGRANALGWMSAGVGVVAIGTGAGAFLAGSW